MIEPAAAQGRPKGAESVLVMLVGEERYRIGMTLATAASFMVNPVSRTANNPRIWRHSVISLFHRYLIT